MFAFTISRISEGLVAFACQDNTMRWSGKNKITHKGMGSFASPKTNLQFRWLYATKTFFFKKAFFPAKQELNGNQQKYHDSIHNFHWAMY